MSDRQFDYQWALECWREMMVKFKAGRPPEIHPHISDVECALDEAANYHRLAMNKADEAAELREALRLIKLACIGTSENDGWTARRILSCVTRICIDAGIKESYRELGTERRYEAITLPQAEVRNRVAFALVGREG